MISNTAEYALRAVVQLARLGGGPATADDIARATQVPPGYISRVLRDLAKSHILTAKRGIGGGFVLARPAGNITVWEVVEAVNGGSQRIRECPLSLGEHDQSLCALHTVLDKAIEQVETAFKTTTIQSILTSDGGNRPLCVIRDTDPQPDGA